MLLSVLFGGAAGIVLAEGASAPKLVLTGKAFCSLKRQVKIPFHGVITSVEVNTGQFVRRGEVLARYRLGALEEQQLRRRFANFQLPEMEIRLLEIEKNIFSAQEKLIELKQLKLLDLVASLGKEQIDREFKLLKRQREVLRERINREKDLAGRERQLVREQLGQLVLAPSGNGSQPEIPKELVTKYPNSNLKKQGAIFQSDDLGRGALLAPVDGYVVSTHPELRVDAEFQAGVSVVQVGVMDPMLVRAHIFEMDLKHISPGDPLEFSSKSFPGRKFEARLNSISWLPLSGNIGDPTYFEAEFLLPNPDIILREGSRGLLVLH